MRLRKFSNKKFKNPQERAKNLSEALKGKHCSPRTEFKKGHKGYSGMLNKKHSKETKKKMREAKLKNPPIRTSGELRRVLEYKQWSDIM